MCVCELVYMQICLSRKILPDEEGRSQTGHTQEPEQHLGTQASGKSKRHQGKSHVVKRKTEYKLTTNRFSMGIKMKLLLCISKGGKCSNQS